MKNLIKVLIVPIFLFVNGCSKNEPQEISKYKQVNLTILLDLSDRIDPTKNPYQIERDKEIIKSTLLVLKNNVIKKGTFNSKDKFRIMFYPQPQETQMNVIASNLSFDLEKLEPKEKKLLFQTIDEKIESNLNELYSLAIKNAQFPGADIWRFFKDEAKDKCIIERENYINYLVVLTDGYVYWQNSMQKNKNRFTWLLPTAAHVTKFRNDPNWGSKFDVEDYGMIPIEEDLHSLKVLFLELNPSKQHPEDFDIIKKYLYKWLNEMNISDENMKVLKTDMPTFTIPIVENFIVVNK